MVLNSAYTRAVKYMMTPDANQLIHAFYPPILDERPVIKNIPPPIVDAIPIIIKLTKLNDFFKEIYSISFETYNIPISC
jgi:hypothetical protein